MTKRSRSGATATAFEGGFGATDRVADEAGACSVSTETEHAPTFALIAFSGGKPVSTFPENARLRRGKLAAPSKPTLALTT
jgi:hypothetical protein